MNSLDALAERQTRAMVVADIRAFDPQVRIGDADLTIMSSWKQHDNRWMVWQFDGTRIEGYFHSAYGAHTEGWRTWLRRTMTSAEYEAYQAGDAAGWHRRDRHERPL